MELSRSKEKKIDKQLRTLADDLKATEEYIEEGKKLCEAVLHCLKKQCKEKQGYFSLAEVHYAGSVGKHTDGVDPDFDVVVKVHLADYDPTSTDISSDLFEPVLAFFHQVLKNNGDSLKITATSLQNREELVQFQFANGMSVDLLPACGNLTREQVLQKIKFHVTSKDPENGKRWEYYSTSNADTQIAFMKKQGSFPRRVARVAKKWLRSVALEDIEKVTVGSVIVELLSVEAVHHLRKGDIGIKERMFQALRRVLESVTQLWSIRLAFKREGTTWKVMEGGDIYAEGRGKVPLIHTGPFILEPGNLYNNLLEKLTPYTRQVLGECAWKQLSRLTCRNWQEKFNVDKLSFERLPGPPGKLRSVPSLEWFPAPVVVPPASVSPPVAYIILAIPPRRFTVASGISTRVSQPVTPSQAKCAKYLENVVDTVVSQKWGVLPRKQLLEAVKSSVASHFEGVVHSASQYSLKMRYFDATISVPFPRDPSTTKAGVSSCIMIGLGWNPDILSRINHALSPRK